MLLVLPTLRTTFSYIEDRARCLYYFEKVQTHFVPIFFFFFFVGALPSAGVCHFPVEEYEGALAAPPLKPQKEKQRGKTVHGVSAMLARHSMRAPSTILLRLNSLEKIDNVAPVPNISKVHCHGRE